MAVNEVVFSTKASMTEVCKRYVRCYVGRDNTFKLTILDELPIAFPNSTVWVAEVDFIKTIKPSGKYSWKIDSLDLSVISAKADIKDLKFNGTYFYVSGTK